MEWRPHMPVVLITGVSSGIGLATLKLLSRSRYRVVGTARAESFEKLDLLELASMPNVRLLPLDFEDPAQCERVVENVTREWGGIDVLINNAGISLRSVLENLREEDITRQMRVNLYGPLEMIRLVLPEMRRRRWGRIINVSSVGGMMAMPTMGAYSASKFALEGASEALWYELKPWKIAVSLVQPGFVRSESFRHVIMSADAKIEVQNNGPYALYYRHMGSFIERMMLRAWATPESIARKILRVVESSKPALRVPATIDAHLFSWIRRFTPRAWYHAFLYHNLPQVTDWEKSARSWSIEAEWMRAEEIRAAAIKRATLRESSGT